MPHEDNKQMQMPDILHVKLMEYLEENDLTLKEFADIIHVPFYPFEKVCNRQIRMYCYTATINKVQQQLLTPIKKQKRIFF